MKEKDNSLSIIRLVAMIMIISCHILQGLNNKWAFWVNVGVQIFFFLSGFLYGKKEIKSNKEFYKKRIIKILFPYTILLTIVLILDIFILKNHHSIKKIIGCYIGLGGFGNNISILSHTWFISYILLCYMIVPLLQKILNKKSFKNNFILFLLIVTFIQIMEIYGVINIKASLINNFIFGYFYSRCCSEEKQRKTFDAFIIGLFIIVLPFAVIYQEHIQITLPRIINSFSKIFVNYGHVLLGTLIFIILYRLLNHFKINNNKLLSFSDKYSYYIYLVHQIFILNSFSVLFLTKYLIINIVLIIILSKISAIILKYITELLLSFYDKSIKNKNQQIKYVNKS